MKDSSNRGRFAEVIAGATWYLLVVAVLPVAGLAIAGLLWSWQSGWILPLLAGWLCMTVLAWLVFVLWPRKRLVANTAAELPEGDQLPAIIDPRAAWTDRDRDIYTRVRAVIDADTDGPITLAWLRVRAVDVVSFVAAEYHGGRRNTALAFTLPEGLLMISVVSTRYRQLIMSHLPFADRIQLASVFTIAEQRSRLETGATWANRLRRGLRLVNPVTAVIGEIRDQFTNHVLSQVGSALKRDLIRLLLQEVAQVAIDLYGGHLSASDIELADHRSGAAVADDSRMAAPVEPLRVVLVGQSSAGKSSLVNALADNLVAEADLLPTTDQLTVYSLDIDELGPLRLVDSPGLDGHAATSKATQDALEDADLILWVVKATQPGRQADAALLSAVREQQMAQPQRRPAPIVMVLTHVDKIPPRTVWAPPYDLLGTPTDPKAANIVKALAAAQRDIGLGDEVPGIPVRLDPGARYNLEAVVAALLITREEAVQAQLNRRRLDYSSAKSSWRDRLTQSANLAKGLTRWAGERLQTREGQDPDNRSNDGGGAN